VAPLLPWVHQLFGLASQFVDVGPTPGEGANPLGFVLDLRWLTANYSRVQQWALDYFRSPFLLAACVGAASAIIRRDRTGLFLLAILLTTSVALLDRATVLFSRYFMLTTYPAYVLAALGLVQLCELLAHVVGRVARGFLSSGVRPLALVAGLAIVVGA